MDKQIQVVLEKITDELKRVVRRQDEIQKTVDMVLKEREILEDIQASLQAFKEIIIQNQQHHDSHNQNLAAGIKNVQFMVEDKVDEAIKKVNNANTIVVRRSFFEKFKKLVIKEKGKVDIQGE